VPQLSFRTSLLDALTLSEEDGAIVAIDWGWARDQAETPLLLRARDQLEEYLDGEREVFDLPLAPHGTPYRQRVWQALLAIPHGEVRTYADIATIAGGSARSVGRANGDNPIPIIIPCHRVVAAAGLGGYSGGDGLETKLRLLHLEGAPVPNHHAPQPTMPCGDLLE
jgi:methylated-DNA-[protein]-cysteine S-methyltransferase